MFTIFHIVKQGRQKWSGCSGFGRTSFSQGKSKIPFLQKASNKQSASVILGLIRLIILNYNRSKRYIKRCKIIGRPRIPPILCSQGSTMHTQEGFRNHQLFKTNIYSSIQSDMLLSVLCKVNDSVVYSFLS